MNQNWQLKAVC